MKIYFDNAATTAVHPKVREKISQYLSDEYGNPSSIHSFGRKARVSIEESREIIADSIGAKASEIYFTSGGTEANNFALFGIAKTEYLESKRNGILTTKVEHHSILDTAEALSKNGFDLTFLAVNNQTEISLESFSDYLNSNTSLVSIIHANNETGTINDIDSISEIVKKQNIYFHTDAVQSYCKLPINVNDLHIDSLTASAHKIHGPKGVGFLYVKNGTPLSPIIFGGSQERNRRAGTENVLGIIGMAEAVKISLPLMVNYINHCQEIREAFISGLMNIDKEGININGGEKILPTILSITFISDFYHNDAESLLMFLDINGIAASNGAACTSGTLKPSHVILASGYNKKDAEGTIRFSFSIYNTIEEVNYTLDILKKLSKKFRK